ncbi:MAG: DUF1801 domain-containing protein [Bacteroidetes bacterium]|nr:DUF1801 domain-containing protein [Bacteroidota bacterium]
MKPGDKFESVDQYLSVFPASTKKMLKEMRKTIKAAAPDAEELISYNMPAFKQEGMLVYYAGYAGHIGFYPVSSAIREFKEDLAGYELSKGTIRLPLDKPLPLKLITKIVKFRVQENMKKSELKMKTKKAKITR